MLDNAAGSVRIILQPFRIGAIPRDVCTITFSPMVGIPAPNLLRSRHFGRSKPFSPRDYRAPRCTIMRTFACVGSLVGQRLQGLERPVKPSDLGASQQLAGQPFSETPASGVSKRVVIWDVSENVWLGDTFPEYEWAAVRNIPFRGLLSVHSRSGLLVAESSKVTRYTRHNGVVTSNVGVMVIAIQSVRVGSLP